MVDQNLVNFVKTAFSKGYSEDYVIKGLKARNWPLNAINEAISVAKSQLQQPSPKPQPPKLQVQPTFKPQPLPQVQPTFKPQPIEIKPQPTTFEKPKPKIEIPHVSIKALSISTLVFLGIFILLAFTLLVYFYMNGIINYTVIDSTTGTKYTKSCIQPDCSDLRAFALESTKSKFILSIIIGIIASALIITIYKLIPVNFKKLFFWGINGLYFIFILIMAIIWIKFSSS